MPCGVSSPVFAPRIPDSASLGSGANASSESFAWYSRFFALESAMCDDLVDGVATLVREDRALVGVVAVDAHECELEVATGEPAAPQRVEKLEA